MYIPRTRLFWAVSLGHFTNDLFLSMGPVILAFLSATILPMTNTEIGFAVSAGQLLGAVTQPGWGLMADRNGGRVMASGGLIGVIGLFMLSLVAAQATGQYWLMFVPFFLRVLGSGALHPVGALHAAESNKSRVASNMAFFFLAGQLGLAAGPAIAGILLDLANTNLMHIAPDMLGMSVQFTRSANLTPIYLFGLFGIPGIVMMATTIPNRTHFRTGVEAERKIKAESGETPLPLLQQFPLGAFAVLGLMVALRGLAQPGSVNFLPVLFEEKGWSPSQYGLITSSFWIASGIAGVAFGQLADRFDRRTVIAASLLLAAPAFFFLPVTDGLMAFVLAMAAGGFTGGSHSIIVVLAQELIPASKGFASGAILGFIFGTGALGSLIIGTVSDSIGLANTFQIVAVTTTLAGLMAFLLPARKKPEPVPIPQ